MPTRCALSRCPLVYPAACACPLPCAHSTNNACGTSTYFAYVSRLTPQAVRRSKAMKGTSLSGFCTIVTHREGIAQVVYAYIGTRKLRNSGGTSEVSLPIRVRISHHLFPIDGKQLRNAYSASAWNI